MNPSTSSYHHGDLRNSAIIAAAKLIETMGNYEITIAQVAAKVGVSPPALYRHFENKEALLTAVRELSHLGLMEYLSAAQKTVAEGTLEHLDALGAAYLKFAHDKKAFFALIWEDHGDAEQKRAEARAKRTGFQVLSEAIELYLVKHQPPNHETPNRIATLMWASAHGIATLRHNRMLDTFDLNANPEDLLKSSTRAILTRLHT